MPTGCYEPKSNFIVAVIEIPGQNLIFCLGAAGVQTIGNIVTRKSWVLGHMGHGSVH